MVQVSRVGGLAAAAVLALPVLAACSDDPPAAAPPPSASSSPTSSAAPSGPPTLPAAAKGTTPAAAKAFVRYYVSLINYTSDNLDSAEMARRSEAQCKTCRLIFRIVRNMNEAGRRYEGGHWVIDSMEELPSAAGHRQVRALINVDDLQVVFPSGKRKNVRANRTSYTFDLVLRGGSWSVAQIVGVS
ncbi:DUF6318 family protein [Nocardioides marmoribigeumensis]|uniref:DUF6318 domain-containing protein n=1 Tax=Nocardioides marmoribigeumensis TaxID=433649 RepID=A0ABU2BSJ3_9ACTN|nr:DUF6318 family protein [Nocardioides marmoribigeumensis]MDR7361612.1 hypothetical protein [Nocardioides marmoribigeumensis]